MLRPVDHDSPQGPRAFQTTRWSLVRRAQSGDKVQAAEALEILCRLYWYPVYAYLRRSGVGAHDAEDLTQAYFCRVVHHDLLNNVDPARGRLRSFLLSCARNFLADERDRARAQKRGGGVPVLSFDAEAAEGRYLQEPSDDVTPDRLFQRRWALSVLQEAMDTLEAEHAAAGRAELFSALRPFLGFGRAAETGYEVLAEQTGLPVGTLKSHVHRLRLRWSKIVFEQVGRTLADPTDENIRDELMELQGYL